MRQIVAAFFLTWSLLWLAGGGKSLEPVNPNPSLLPGQSQFPQGYEILGNALYANLGELQKESSGWGVRFFSDPASGPAKSASGEIRATLRGITAKTGRWFRLTLRALAQENFHVEKDALYLKAEFFKDQGKTPLDQVKKLIFPQVELDRKTLLDSGTSRKLGPSTWRVFSFDFRTPFPEIDTLRVSAGFENGAGKGAKSEFYINWLEVNPIPDPNEFSFKKGPAESQAILASLIPLGGRWYFDPRKAGKALPKQFDHTNADQLLYKSDKLIAPFAGNTTSWLRKGYLDKTGALVQEDRFIEDNVSISVNQGRLVIRSKNLPNHPTAIFPDRWRALDGNPNIIAEQNFTLFLPLQPLENPKRVAMKNKNNNDQALPMGPIGVACNGIIFFNPFDHLLDEDAVWRLDRCCGHPAQKGQYHYHKYPVCLKSPWTDEGEAHSPVIGFAFDGFPLYGPYETKGQLAREAKSNPLNEFNVHFDEERGWHYHVTPGMFPHIIGGYWGVPDPENRMRGGPPGGGKDKEKKGFPKGGKKGPPKQ
ncbi:MAG: YHYH protein [Gemmataceae bacterium]|nr:YHYH protein [Gemmataceae bacterium]